MANVLEYVISLKDGFTPALAKIASASKAFGASVASAFENTKEATDEMQSAVSKMQTVVSSGFGAMTGDFSKLGNVLGALPGPIGVVGQAVGDTLGKMLQDTIDTAEGFRKLSERTGASVEFLSGFTEAADDMFVSSQSVSSALGIFAKKLGGVEDAMDGSGISAGAFSAKLREIGVNSDDVQEALLTVADRFKGMKDGTEKTALAVQLFGKQGAELIPILNKGRDGINEMSAAAKAMGLVMTDETIAAVREMKTAQDELNDTVLGFTRTIGIMAIPALNDFGKGMKDNNSITFQVVEALYPFAKILTIVNERTKVLKREQDEQTAALNRGKDAYSEIGSRISAVAKPMLDLTHTTVDMGTALDNVDGPTREVGQLLRETEQAAQDSADAFRIATIKEYDNKQAAEQLAAKQQFLADATNNVNSAFGGTPQAMDNAQKAMEIFKLNTGGTTKAQFEQQQAMEAIRKALDLGILSYSDAAKALIGLRDGTLTTEDAFKRAGAAGAEYRKETELLIAASDRLKPKEVTLTVHNRWDDGGGVWDRYVAAQDKTVTVRFNMVQGTNVETDQGGNTRAKGGPVKKGQPYIVGEQGQEMFVPYTSGYIVPNSSTPGTRAAGATANTFNMSSPEIIINSVNGAAIAQQIQRQTLGIARRARARASLMG